MSEGPEQTGQDQDSEPTSAAGAASPQAEQADDKEQAEGDDTGQPGACPHPGPDGAGRSGTGLWTAASGGEPTALGWERSHWVESRPS